MAAIRDKASDGDGELVLHRHSASFGGMCWPRIGGDVAQIGWRLRYAGEHGSPLTESEKLIAASIVDAYITLVHRDERRRREIIRELRHAERRAATYPELKPED